jgi:hypothetical protein
MEFHLVKVAHLKHCMAYKKTVFKCIFPSLPFSEEIEKYLFTFVGVFSLPYGLKHKVSELGPSPFQGSFPLQRYDPYSLQNIDDDSEAYEP